MFGCRRQSNLGVVGRVEDGGYRGQLGHKRRQVAVQAGRHRDTPRRDAEHEREPQSDRLRARDPKSAQRAELLHVKKFLLHFLFLLTYTFIHNL